MTNFLGDKGISTTKANHFANVTKEIVENAERRLSDYNPTTQVALLPEQHVTVTEENFNVDEVEKILDVRPKLFALSAWLRSGIKEKERLLDEIEAKVFPREDAPQVPEREAEADMDWFFNKLNVRERAEFLAEEARAAAYGQFIHGRGIIKKWQNECGALGLGQCVVAGREVPMKISHTKGTATKVDELLYAIQKKHRTHEARLNYWKARSHDEISAENRARLKAYETKVREYKVVQSEFQTEHNARIQEFEAEKLACKQATAQLKVIIPEDLQGVFDEVSEYAEAK